MTDAGAPLVKICGIQEEATLQGMNGLPVDYIGFVFAKSRRQVSPERAAQLLAFARRTNMAGGMPPRTVGVFVNPTLETLADTLSRVPLDVIQLHGEETPAFAREVGERFGAEVWRALPVQEPDEASASGDAGGPARLADYRGAASAVLLDTAGGGTGRAFRWDRIPVYRKAAEALGLKLFVAGGLHPGNVRELIDDYAPHGVDISSGVETDGAKDNAKIAAFTERVKRQP
ncbi:phosphoribosylanthranilate isomerase [Cohnella nanjingensis]|uniref:N-(5'-phosphoribosyl)anthranilate isomerase n=1 Tax=Cohnella nanjingensis TaxID=1387779 RepID=A0A7X0RX71_9BACL|nr:phosphoribosylanthranilate isomerase [Cohnella nanjingensis]MBB6674131.1 phosphoribosylanthranilate isomerase [Cohnella nanjingensis]